MSVSDYSTTPGDNTSISGLTVTDATVVDTLDNIIRQLMADIASADAANLKSTAIGTTVQAYDADLTAIAGLTSAANKLPYYTGSGAAALADLTSFGRSLIDDASASAARTTLGLGTAAVAELIDDDTLATASATNVASAESVKAYVDASSTITAATAQATTSGTEFDFTGIPSTAKRITVNFSGVSLDGSNSVLVQAIVSGSPVTSGYVSFSGGTGSGLSAVGNDSTAGFIATLGNATRALSGSMIITKDTGNMWVATHALRCGGSGAVAGGGEVSLGGTLAGIRITRSGSDNFDAGSVNIVYE